MNRPLALLILLIAIIALSAGAPISSESKQESPQNVTPASSEDSSIKWWDIIREHLLYPTFKLISDNSKEEKPDFKNAPSSSETSSKNSSSLSTTTTPISEPIEPPKFFTFLDEVVYEIANLTFLGYIYIGVLVTLLLIIFCCTGCCCCCCGCCGCCRGGR